MLSKSTACRRINVYIFMLIYITIKNEICFLNITIVIDYESNVKHTKCLMLLNYLKIQA